MVSPAFTQMPDSNRSLNSSHRSAASPELEYWKLSIWEVWNTTKGTNTTAPSITAAPMRRPMTAVGSDSMGIGSFYHR